MNEAPKDRRCWRFRKADDGSVARRIFNSPDDVPEGQGWQDSPAKLEAGQEVEAEEEPEQPKPRRGRPKGSKNKPKSPPETVEAEDAAEA